MTHIVLAIVILGMQQTPFPKPDPAEVAAAEKKGWKLKETTDQGTGIFRRFYVSVGKDGELKQGVSRTWYKNGARRTVSMYVDDERQGVGTWWHENGTKWQQGKYKDDLPDGDWTFWNQEGKKIKGAPFSKGVLDGRATYWFTSGQKAAEGPFKDGMPNGPWKIWNAGSRKPRALTFFDGYASPSGVPPQRPLKTPPDSGAPLIDIDAKVDPRMELLAVVQSFTTWAKTGVFSTIDEQYRRDVDAWFGPYKDHSAIKLYEQMLQGDTNFAFDAPVWMMLHLGDPPELAPVAPLPGDILKRVGGEEQFEKLRNELKAFVKDSRFMEFYAQHRPFYNELERSYQEASPGSRALKLVMDYYGEVKSSGTSIICPLFGGGNYGVLVKQPSGEEHIYNVGAPQLFENGKFAFDKASLETLVFHEFGHSFANPAVDANPDWVKLEAEFFPPVKAVMAQQAYGTWQNVVRELFVRTNEIHLMELYGDTKRARTLLGNYYSKRGFVWLPYTLMSLSRYEANRDKYKTFREFVPEVVKTLEGLQMVVINDELVCVVPKANQ